MSLSSLFQGHSIMCSDASPSYSTFFSFCSLLQVGKHNSFYWTWCCKSKLLSSRDCAAILSQRSTLTGKNCPQIPMQFTAIYRVRMIWCFQSAECFSGVQSCPSHHCEGNSKCSAIAMSGWKSNTQGKLGSHLHMHSGYWWAAFHLHPYFFQMNP